MTSRRPIGKEKSPEILNDSRKDGQKPDENALTVSWHHLPAWQQDNHYIISGYRPASNSYTRSFASLGYIHNETVNIYTHLIGAFTAISGGIYSYRLLRPRYEHASQEDVLVFACFFAGAALCLGMSATYHTISNHSPRVNRIGNQFDYVGIVCLIWGSFVPSIYYGFHHEPRLRWTYWVMASFFVLSPPQKGMPLTSPSRSPLSRPAVSLYQ